MAAPSVCEHIHFPLQSGSDRVLKAMRRSYRRDRYLGWLDAIRRAIPDVAGTDVIVGFPGETEEDFADTLDLVERARFDSAYTFQYSPRPAGSVVRGPDPEGGSSWSVLTDWSSCSSGSHSNVRSRRSVPRSRCW